MSHPLRLVEIEGKGRGYVATEPLKGGQVIFRESPILVYSAYPLKRSEHQELGSVYSRYCAHCYKSLVSGTAGDCTALTCLSCSHPDYASFCSRNCQSLALSSTHSPFVCESLNYLRNCPLLSDNQPEERQVQARYLVTAYNLAMISPSAFQTLLSLHGNGARYMDIATFLHPIISSLPFPKGFDILSIGMSAGLLDKEMSNSFNLMEPRQESGKRGIRAYALYPNVSLFNHSCMPNACRFEYIDSETDGNNTDIIIRMMHDVPEGQEICLSYVRVNRTYSDRKKRLLEYFGFVCVCDRCKVEANSSQDESNCFDFGMKFVCDKENCGGTLAPLPTSADGCSSDYMECNYCGSLKNHKL
ncbi:histone-lysine N-methyltransferase ASHR2-like [Silene latifolia]|uniref:histone-lysine N-methyltransferase ASHR2-like n=1 Tax=Silene latifolia TaxID=37657 RepID=UPI003D77C964